MIFKKVVIDGKEYYQRVDSLEENNAPEVPENAEVEEELIEGEITDAPDDNRDSLTRDAQEFFDKLGEGAKNIGTKIADGAKDIGRKLADGAKDLGKKIKEGTESLFGRDKSLDPDSTEARLLRLLPYMEKSQTHEVVEKIMANDSAVISLDIATIMPFIESEDCDALFVRCIELGNDSYDIAKAMPFVSKECLEGVVSGYIEGRYDKLEIDTLYPFLPDDQIKRIFYHILSSGNEAR